MLFVMSTQIQQDLHVVKLLKTDSELYAAKYIANPIHESKLILINTVPDKLGRFVASTRIPSDKSIIKVPLL